MRRILSLVTVLSFLFSLGLSSALVSAAPGNSGNHRSPVRLQDVGDTVSVPDIDGNEIGSVTVEDLEDNFDGFEEKSVAGLQYVSILLTIENTSEDPIPVEPGNIGLVDDSGLVYVDIEVTRTDNGDELEAGDVEPGDTVEGYLEIAQLIWIAGQGQLPVLLNYADPIAEGDEVTLVSSDYEEEAIITTEAVTFDFDDFAKGLNLSDDFKFIGAEITVENTGTEDLVIDPATFFMATSDGVFWVPDTSLVRSDDAIDEIPDFSDEPIAAGDSYTGYVTYSILQDQDASYIFYLPDGFRMVRIFDVESDSRDNNGGLGPLGGSRDSTPDDEDVTPSDEETPRANTGDDCEGAADYAETTIEGLSTWSEALQSIDFKDPNVADIEDAIDAVSQLAEDQADIDIPPAAEDFNDQLVTAYEDTADALGQILDGVNDGDTALIGEGAGAIGEIADNFSNGDIADSLAEAEDVCPDLSDL